MALGGEFEKRGQGLFKRVKKVTLLDAQARPDVTLVMLGSFTKEMGSDDGFVFVYSSPPKGNR